MRLSLLKKLSSLTVGGMSKSLAKGAWKNKKKLTGAIAAGALTGAAVGSNTAQVGHKADSAKHGAVYGAAIGAGILATKLVFRRIRGRIIPIRVKR